MAKIAVILITFLVLFFSGVDESVAYNWNDFKETLGD
jgi:hypothetical protein